MNTKKYIKLKELALQGDAEAQLSLGEIYDGDIFCKGVNQDQEWVDYCNHHFK